MRFVRQNFTMVRPEFKDGDECIECNFAQELPDTDIALAEDMTFTRCNLVNVVVPKSAVLTDSLAVNATKPPPLSAEAVAVVEKAEAGRKKFDAAYQKARVKLTDKTTKAQAVAAFDAEVTASLAKEAL